MQQLPVVFSPILTVLFSLLLMEILGTANLMATSILKEELCSKMEKKKFPSWHPQCHKAESIIRTWPKRKYL